MPPSVRRTAPRILRYASLAAMVVLLWYTWVGLERQITWYLAVDQFGYLTFAHDLLKGKIFTDWRPLEALGWIIPPRTDILAQTYVKDGNVAYCRYSPGFPIILATWIGLLGDERAHYLNPTIFLALLTVAFFFQWRLFRSPWRAGAGTAMITVFPTFIHLWGLTLTRDLAAHLSALIGLFLLLPVHGRRLGFGRVLAAGLALGFAVTTRPDAVLYLIPAAGIALLRWGREGRGLGPLARATAAGAIGFVIGVAPFLAYNRAATGNPFLPTQGMELPLLPSQPLRRSNAAPRVRMHQPPAVEGDANVGYPSPGWRGGTHEQVQGGGLRISNLATTLPGNWAILNRAYTPQLLGLALWGVVVAFVFRPLLLVSGLLYGLVAFLFFSCWPRPDHRYLVGVFVFLPMFLVEGTVGTLDLIRLCWRRRQRELGRSLGVAMALLLGCAIAIWGWATTPPLSTLSLLLPIVAGVGAIAGGLSGRRVAAIAAPVLMVAIVAVKVSRVDAEATRRAPFQRTQMLQARANLNKLIEPGAVIITSEETGRPAENIEFYSGIANAMYLTDLERWRLPIWQAAAQLLLAGMRPYLYIASGQDGKAEMLQELREHFTVDLVADIPPDRAMLHFVAAPFHRGLRMELYRISSPTMEDAAKKLKPLRLQPSGTSAAP